MDNCIGIANLALTFLLVITAGIAARVGWSNLKILREQLKYNTLLTLLKELSDKDVRKSRALIHSTFLDNHKEIESTKQGVIEGTEQDLKDAIEVTISVMDRIGYFLLKGEPNLNKDAPEWIWEITGQMWHRVNWYVAYRKQTSKKYAMYFEELALDVRAQEHIEKPTVQLELEN